MSKIELIQAETPEKLAASATFAWLDLLGSTSTPDDGHCVALSGGRIAKTFFSAVSKEVSARKVSLAQVHFFWADERCVPPQDAESNFRIANELLLMPLGIARDHIHRIRGEESPEFACAEAEAEICRVASLNAEGQPVLDLILLGMGEDGHVASLFPEESVEARADAAVYRAVTASKPPPKRITIGYKTIAAAREVWVLASGTGKASALKESLLPLGNTPLARVVQSRQKTRIFTDISAA